MNAAAAYGVPVGGMYRNGSALMVRIPVADRAGLLRQAAATRGKHEE